MATLPVEKAVVAVGTVIKLSKMGLQQVPCVQLRCRQMDYSAHLRTYFGKHTDLWALDADAKAKIGDMVLIRRSDPKVLQTTSNVCHIVERVIFKFGVVIDPVTKRRVIRENWQNKLTLQKNLVEEIIETPKSAESNYAERRKLQDKLIADMVGAKSTENSTSK